jgi:hypothetical protein
MLDSIVYVPGEVWDGVLGESLDTQADRVEVSLDQTAYRLLDQQHAIVSGKRWEVWRRVIFNINVALICGVEC